MNCKVVGRQCKYADVQVNPVRSSRARKTLQLEAPAPPQSPTRRAFDPARAGGVANHASPASTSSVAVGHPTGAAESPSSSVWSHTTTAPSQINHASSSGTTQDEKTFIPSIPTPESIARIEIDGPRPSSRNVAAPGTTSIDHHVVNVDHMELLIHFSLTKAAAFTEFEKSNELLELGTNLILQKAMTNTTLLHQVLAISARYLSLKRPERHDHYSHQAVQLQTKAIELFQQTKKIDETNCEAMLLFSSLLNRQVLADALSNREGDFSAFLGRFIQAGQLHRGIRVVSRDTWPMLLKSDLLPLLQSCGSDPADRQEEGKECETLRRLIDLSSKLDPVQKGACRSAVHFIQIGFDDVKRPQAHYAAYNMIYLLFIFLPEEFVTLLTDHKPEALIILSYFAVLLHYGRENWVVGDSGAFLLQGISKHLGVEWAHWLEWPLQQLSETRIPGT